MHQNSEKSTILLSNWKLVQMLTKQLQVRNPQRTQRNELWLESRIRLVSAKKLQDQKHDLWPLTPAPTQEKTPQATNNHFLLFSCSKHRTHTRIIRINRKPSSPSNEGTTVFLSASTNPRGDPNRKKSVTSKSNFPKEPPSSMVLLLERLDPGSPWRTLEWRLKAERRLMQSEFIELNWTQNGSPVFKPLTPTPRNNGVSTWLPFLCTSRRHNLHSPAQRSLGDFQAPWGPDSGLCASACGASRPRFKAWCHFFGSEELFVPPTPLFLFSTFMVPKLHAINVFSQPILIIWDNTSMQTQTNIFFMFLWSRRNSKK